jgi:hypothetical protein
MDMVHGSWTDGAPGYIVDRSGAGARAAVAHGVPGTRARRWGGRGRAGQGEAVGWLTKEGSAAEGRRDGATDRDGSGFAEMVTQTLGRRVK